jgi:hypothetical protein
MKLKNYLTEDKISDLVKKAQDLGGVENNPFKSKQQRAVIIWHDIVREIIRNDERLDGSIKSHENYAYELGWSMIQKNFTDFKKMEKELKIPLKDEYKGYMKK